MTILDEIEAAIPALRRYAGALVRDRDAADDLVQDCLERAVARRGDWSGQGPVRAWLFRILLNRHRDLRRSAPRPGHLVPVEGLFPEPAVLPSQDGHLAVAEVRAAMERLPDDQRHALLLVALEGLSFEAAAEALEIPKGTLMSRLARARANLRALTGREPRTKGMSR
jgi:RNA polymerase sigma-70 factor (ECF subfamily)